MAADRSLVIGKRWSGTVIASSVLGQRPSTLYYTWPKSDQVRLIPFPDDLGPFLAA